LDKITDASAEVAPEGRRKRRSAEELTDRILEAAREEFKRCGYAGTTTAAVARAAEVTEAQLFRYFGSKANLFREAVFKPLDEQLSAFFAETGPPPEDLESFHASGTRYIEELQQFMGENAGLLASLAVAQTYDPEAADAAFAAGSLAKYFERGAGTMAGRVRGTPKVEPKLMVRVSFAAVLACVMFRDWLFPPGLASEADIRKAIDIFVLEGISANFTGSPPESEPKAGGTP
jgi:AcrR family transcriptional regulator